MRCIAHRGFAKVNPENTVTAVRSAAEHTDVIEIDVRRCGSGELVVIHDETVERVTDGTGRVAELSADELTALDVLESGEGVPTLPSLLESGEHLVDVLEAVLVPVAAPEGPQFEGLLDGHEREQVPLLGTVDDPVADQVGL